MSGGGNGGVYNSKNLSLFSYTYNNPVNLVDQDGMKPDINRFTTVTRVVTKAPISYESHHRGNARWRNSSAKYQNMVLSNKLSSFYKTKSRYLYTEKRGPIDLRHFFAATAQSISSDKDTAIARGEMMEIGQSLLSKVPGIKMSETLTGWADSANDYEDRPSNQLGAMFGEYLKENSINSAEGYKNAFSNFINQFNPKNSVPSELKSILGKVPDSNQMLDGNPLRDYYNHNRVNEK